MKYLFFILFFGSFALFSASSFFWEFPPQTMDIEEQLGGVTIPSVASNDLGDVVIVYWQQTDTPSEELLGRHSRDFGITWSEKKVISTAIAPLHFPKVIIDSSGNVIAFFGQFFSDGIFRSTMNINVGIWSSLRLVFSSVPTSLISYKVVMDDNGHAVACGFVQIGTDFEIQRSESTSFGNNWTSPIVLVTNPFMDFYVPVIDHYGNAIIAYTNGSAGTDVISSLSPSPFFHWSSPTTISSSLPLALANNNFGNAILLTRESDGSNDRIKEFYSLNFGNAGSWSSGQFISAMGEDVTLNANVSMLDDGHTLASWQKVESGGFSTIKSNDSLDNGITWDLSAINTLSKANAIIDIPFHLAFREDGFAFAVWGVKNLGHNVLESNHSLDFGKRWNSPIFLSDERGNVFGGSAISLDSDYAWVIWQETLFEEKMIRLIKGTIALSCLSMPIEKKYYDFWLQKEKTQEVSWGVTEDAIKYNIYEGTSGLVQKDGKTPIKVVFPGEELQFVIHNLIKEPNQDYYITWENTSQDESAPIFFSSNSNARNSIFSVIFRENSFIDTISSIFQK